MQNVHHSFETNGFSVFLASDSETALDAVKLGDFGIGVVVDDNTPDTYAGTTIYRPPVAYPNILNHDEYLCCHRRYSRQTWSEDGQISVTYSHWVVSVAAAASKFNSFNNRAFRYHVRNL